MHYKKYLTGESRILRSFFLLSYVGEGHGAQYITPAMEEKESDRLRVDGGQIKFIDRRFERWQVVGFTIGRRRPDFSYH